MRISILLFVLISFLSVGDANAKPGSNQRPAHMDETCDELEGGTPGLYGLCVAFCSERDQSNVDLNDIASVKAAAPRIETLRRYNALKRNHDPDMLCMPNTGSGGDDPAETSGGDSGGDSDGDSGGDSSGDSTGGTGSEEPPPPAQCGCWTGAELASIDGVSSSGDTAAYGVDCTANNYEGVMYQDQVVEGYDFLGLITREGVAWASFDAGDIEPYNGCYFSTADGVRNFPLELADAKNCVSEIAAHCAMLGNP